jgi:hypothetical protein
MRTGRSLAMIALAAAALATGGARTGAQEQPSPTPPDLRMLLNLDLFKPHSSDVGDDTAGQGSNDSMLDQIRALKAMGYLRGNQGDTASAPGASAVSGARVTTPTPPPTDSEGQP